MFALGTPASGAGAGGTPAAPAGGLGGFGFNTTAPASTG